MPRTSPPRRASSSPPVLTLSEVADVCGVSRGTVIRWVAREDPLPTSTVGLRRRVVFPDNLRAWAERNGVALLDDPTQIARPFPRRGAA